MNKAGFHALIISAATLAGLAIASATFLEFETAEKASVGFFGVVLFLLVDLTCPE